jgi:hypothetical protein
MSVASNGPAEWSRPTAVAYPVLEGPGPTMTNHQIPMTDEIAGFTPAKPPAKVR